MAFLSGLAAFGGGFADEALAVQTAKSNQLLKQEQIQLREAQLSLLMQKTTQAQQTSQDQASIYSDPAYQALISGQGAAPSDPTALPYASSDASPAATGGPPAAPGAAKGGRPAAPVWPAGGVPRAATPQRTGQAQPAGQPPVTQVAPAGQPAGAAGAAMPAPPPVGGSTLSPGDPLAQFGQQLQGAGQARAQAGAQPQMPPGPQGAPSFDQRWQDPTPMQAKPVQTQRIPGQQPSLGGGPPQAPLPDQTFRPQQPKGKRLFDVATPEQQAEAGITQPQQSSQEQQQKAQAQKMAQAPEATIAEIVKRHTRNPADFSKNFQNAMKYYQMESTRRRQERILELQEGREKRIAEKEKKEGEPDPEAVKLGALEYYKTGKVTATGKGGEKFREAARKEALETYGKVDPFQNWPTEWQKYKGEGQYYRTASGMAARVENAVNEAIEILPLAIKSSQEYFRGPIVPFNELWNKFKRGTSDPKYNTFMANNVALLTAYTKAMNPQGVPRVNDRLEAHAVGLLNMATSHEGYMAQVRAIWQEMQASKKATFETREGPGKPGDVNAPLPGGGEKSDDPLGIR